MENFPKRGQMWTRLDDEEAKRRFIVHGTMTLGGTEDVYVVVYQQVSEEGHPEGNVKVYSAEPWDTVFKRWVEPWFDDEDVAWE